MIDLLFYVAEACVCGYTASMTLAAQPSVRNAFVSLYDKRRGQKAMRDNTGQGLLLTSF